VPEAIIATQVLAGLAWLSRVIEARKLVLSIADAGEIEMQVPRVAVVPLLHCPALHCHDIGSLENKIFDLWTLGPAFVTEDVCLARGAIRWDISER